MYIVKPSKNWAGSKAGETYVLERANAGQLLVMQKPEMIEQVDGLKLRGKGTLIVRPGGIGDLVHMDAAVREVAKHTSGDGGTQCYILHGVKCGLHGWKSVLYILYCVYVLYVCWLVYT